MPIHEKQSASLRSSGSDLAMTAALAMAVTGCGSAPPSPSREDPPPAAAPAVERSPAQRQPQLTRSLDAPHAAGEASDVEAEPRVGEAVQGQFEAALEAIKAAASSEDQAELAAQVRDPLLFIDAAGERHELPADQLNGSRFEEVFAPQVIALLRGLEWEDLTVVPGEGAFAELGAIWLVPEPGGGRPRIATVNLQALEEAAAASAHPAQD